MALIPYEKLTMGSAGVNIQNEIACFFQSVQKSLAPILITQSVVYSKTSYILNAKVSKYIWLELALDLDLKARRQESEDIHSDTVYQYTLWLIISVSPKFLNHLQSAIFILLEIRELKGCN